MKPRHRKLIRRAWRTTLRRRNRSCLRACWRAPDDLARALTAFRHAIRARRCLAKLAPSFFDPAVVDRQTRERAEHRHRMQTLEPIIEKYYGPTTPAERLAGLSFNLPRLPGPRTQRAVERELAAWDFWLAIGALAIARFQQRRPHALLSFRQLARLLDVASALGRSAGGLTPAPAEPAPLACAPGFQAALERAYGR